MTGWRWRTESKYKNKPTRCRSGVLHASKREAFRCDQLSMLERAGVVSGLRAHPQPRYELEINGVKLGRYVADFEYTQDGRRVVEDSKGGVKTPVYRLKKLLMKACLGIEVVES